MIGRHLGSLLFCPQCGSVPRITDPSSRTIAAGSVGALGECLPGLSDGEIPLESSKALSSPGHREELA